MIYQELLERIPNIPIGDMSNEEWLEKRRGSIGGSDAGALMGYAGRYGSPLTVFLQKKGLEKSREMSPAAKRGKLLEPLVRDWFADANPDAVIERVPYMFYRPGTEIMSANIDGLILAKNPLVIGGKECAGLGGLEIKSSRDGFDFGEDEIPDSYYAQVQHYMAVLNLPWFVVSAAIISKDAIQNYIIPRNDEFIGELVKTETGFWNKYITPNEWPPAMGIDGEEDMITGMFEGGSSLVLGEDERELCRQYRDAQERFKAADEEKDRISTELKARLVQKQNGSGERKISAIAGPYSISWSRYEMSRVDTDALKKAGIYDRYSKKIETGRLTISEKRKGA